MAEGPPNRGAGARRVVEDNEGSQEDKENKDSKERKASKTRRRQRNHPQARKPSQHGPLGRTLENK